MPYVVRVTRAWLCGVVVLCGFARPAAAASTTLQISSG